MRCAQVNSPNRLGLRPSPSPSPSPSPTHQHGDSKSQTAGETEKEQRLSHLLGERDRAFVQRGEAIEAKDRELEAMRAELARAKSKASKRPPPVSFTENDRTSGVLVDRSHVLGVAPPSLTI